MPTKDILNTYSVVELRKEISKTNIKGYSKMKKSEVIELMMKPEHKAKFHHMKGKEHHDDMTKKDEKKRYKIKKKDKPNKGGCKVGKKGEGTGGGCKIGKK